MEGLLCRRGHDRGIAAGAPLARGALLGTLLMLVAVSLADGGKAVARGDAQRAGTGALRVFRFAGVSCWSVKGCEAVGRGPDVYPGVGFPAADGWNGDRWYAQVTPGLAAPILQPSPGPYANGAGDGALDAVSCFASNACTAVGYENLDVMGASLQVQLVERWDGRSWSVRRYPLPPRIRDAILESISCPSRLVCVVVGSGSRGAFAQRLGPRGPSTQSVPTPPGVSGFSSVSCPSPTACTAVGLRAADVNAADNQLVEQWNGAVWKRQPLSRPAGADVIWLSGVSCSTRSCVAVGISEAGASCVDPQLGSPCVTTPLIERQTNGTWSLRLLSGKWSNQPDSGARLSAVSCTSDRFCMAVGEQNVGPAVLEPLAERWNGRTWSALPTAHAAQAELRSVSCTSATACTAVGDYSRTRLALAERWNGKTWSIQPAP
jgi:hypothetical protein